MSLEGRIKDIIVTEDTISTELMDGRTISAEGMLYGIPAPRHRMSSTFNLKSEKRRSAAKKGIQRVADKAGFR